MDYYHAISRGFQETIELIAASVDMLVDPLHRASDVCSEALLREQKILSCGNGAAAAVAEMFTTHLLHRFEHDRPALPALCLNGDGINLSAVAAASNANDLYSRQVRALGQPGDILVCVAGGGGNASIIQAIRAAHDRDVRVILLSGGGCADVASLLLPEDIELRVPSERLPRVIEMQTMIIHSLCELIDQALFGSYYE
jgi:phosphoheptose isomerase